MAAVIQDGARLHYALPLALQREGALSVMYTDWFVRPNSSAQIAARILGQLWPDVGKRLAGRSCPGLDARRVATSEWLAMRAWLTWIGSSEPADKKAARLSARLGSWVAGQGWRDANCLIGFVRNIDPRLCELAKAARMVTLVDQMIAPAEVEYLALQRQAERWPDWVPAGQLRRPSEMMTVERRTWSAATQITCPSEYVRDGLIAQGISPQSVSVLPYPLDADAWECADRSGRTGPVTVGFVGAVGLRKGAPAVVEIAGRFDPFQVQFEMVGPLAVPPQILAGARERVTLSGSVPRSAVRERLNTFDVFFLPSTCEGSAGAVIEAMASGLPVVTTPSSGTPVRDGVEGFVRDCDDLDGLATCVERLVADPQLRWRMGVAARKRAEEFGIESYGHSLQVLLQRLLDAAP
jgi:glycosyltransferase involved in cell wall biosynthesis